MTQDDRKPFSRWITDLCFESQQGLCSRCSVSLESEPFQIHHKDGDHSNNELSNCELLCIKCHHKTFPENAYEKHKSQETKVLTMLNQILEQATDPASKMSGATLEKLIEGLSMSLKVSRNATDLDYGMLRTPPSIKLRRNMADQEARQDAFFEGYSQAVKDTLSRIDLGGKKK